MWPDHRKKTENKWPTSHNSLRGRAQKFKSAERRHRKSKWQERGDDKKTSAKNPGHPRDRSAEEKPAKRSTTRVVDYAGNGKKWACSERKRDADKRRAKNEDMWYARNGDKKGAKNAGRRRVRNGDKMVARNEDRRDATNAGRRCAKNAGKRRAKSAEMRCTGSGKSRTFHAHGVTNAGS